MQILRINRDRSSIEHAGDGSVWARIAPEPLSRIGVWTGLEGWLADVAKNGVSRVIVHPGNAHGGGGPEEEGSDEADPIRSAWQSWAPSGQLLMAESVRRLDEACAAVSVRPILWPRVHSLISDIPGLLGVTRRWERVGVLLDPIALFAGNGAGQFADFAGRLQEVIGLPGVNSLVLGEAKGNNSILQELASLVRMASARGLPILLSHQFSPGELEAMGISPAPDRT